MNAPKENENKNRTQLFLLLGLVHIFIFALAVYACYSLSFFRTDDESSSSAAASSSPVKEELTEVALVLESIEEESTAEEMTAEETTTEEMTIEEIATEEMTTEELAAEELAAEAELPEEPQAEELHVPFTYKGTQRLNIRSGPSADDSIIGKIPPDSGGVITAVANEEWVEIDYSGVKGYCSSRCLTYDKDEIKQAGF